MTTPPTELDALRGSPFAVVTGASGGIGRCLAARLAERGLGVVLIARREPALRETADALPDDARCAVVPVDLADAEATGRAIDTVCERAGTPDVFVHCAGLGQYQPMLAHGPDIEQRVMRVNYHAAAQIIRRTLPGMLERGSGAIINVASIAVNMGPWGHAAYTASKAAVVAMTQSLAAEHAGSGVNFGYVKPGIVRTAFFESPDMQPLWKRVEKHAIDPDLVARRIARLLDRPRLELVVPRHYRVLDWINAISPTLLHRLVTRNSRPDR